MQKHPEASFTDIARMAGYDGPAPVEHVRGRLEGKTPQAIMAALMDDDERLNMLALRERLAMGLDATKIQRGYDKGEVVDENTDPDYAMRHAYLRLAGRWRGIEASHELTGADGGPLEVRIVSYRDEAARPPAPPDAGKPEAQA